MVELLRARSAGQWVLLGMVAIALFFLGLYDEQVRTLLTHWFEPAHAAATAASAKPAIGGATLTTRSLPAMLTFGVLYLTLSLLTLHLALADRRQSILVLLCYIGAAALIVVLLGAGKVLGVAATFTPLARELIDVVLSPLPVLLLLAVFRLAPR